jgi:hypothetical protein
LRWFDDDEEAEEFGKDGEIIDIESQTRIGMFLGIALTMILRS